LTLQLSIKMNRSLSKLIDYYHNSKMWSPTTFKF
jgi:hypothetical protein